MLTDITIRNARPKENPYSLFDGKGLYLIITPHGGKWWRFKYRFGGKAKLLSLGTYPEINLSKARERQAEARSHVAQGIDPSALRKAKKEAQVQEENTFEVVAREWFEKHRDGWVSSHGVRNLSRLERLVFPHIGSLPIATLKATDILTVLRRIEERGVLETAHRVRSLCGQVLRYAIATGRAEHDSARDLRGALPSPKKRHMPAITAPVKVGDLLRAIDGYRGSFIVQCALKLQALTFVRPGELRKAEWAEFTLDAATWEIPAHRMKMKQPHIVPLSRQAVAMLRDLHALTGRARYVFPCERSEQRPMSENAVLAALRYLGYGKDEMTGHGFRATARTLLDEVLHVRPDLIEHQLAHAVRDPLGRAYNRTSHLPERRKMMQTWADYLDRLRDGAKVIPLRAT